VGLWGGGGGWGVLLGGGGGGVVVGVILYDVCCLGGCFVEVGIRCGGGVFGWEGLFDFLLRVFWGVGGGGLKKKARSSATADRKADQVLIDRKCSARKKKMARMLRVKFLKKSNKKTTAGR